MVGIQNFTRLQNILIDPVCLFPGHTGHPVQIIANHCGFCTHRAHIAQLFQLGFGLVPGFFWHFGSIDLLGNFIDLIAAILALAQLFLNGLHLLIQIIFALGFFHLAFDAVANAFFHLQHADLAFHNAINRFQTFLDILDFQQFLFFDDFHGQMRGNRIGNLAGFFNLVDRHHHFRSDFFI